MLSEIVAAPIIIIRPLQYAMISSIIGPRRCIKSLVLLDGQREMLLNYKNAYSC